jgi:hypothetical protein
VTSEYQRRLRVEITDTAWAFFPTNQGVNMDGAIAAVEGGPSLLSFVNGPKNEESIKVWKQLAKFLMADSKDDIESAMQRIDNAFFLSWAEDSMNPKTYSGYFVSNIAEYQAKELAAKCNIKSWLHANAFYDEGERIPTNLTECKFIDSNVVDDDAPMTYRGEPIVITGGPKLNEFFQTLNIKWAPGVLGVARTAPKVYRAMKRKYPFAEGLELAEKLAQFVEAKRKANVSAEDITKALGLAGDEVLVAVIPPQDEEVL